LDDTALGAGVRECPRFLKSQKGRKEMKKLAVLVAMLAMALVAAVPALAAPGPGDSDLGLDGITVTSTTIDSKTKELTVSGTVTCSEPLSVFVQGSVRQDVGRFNTVQGFGWTEVACEGETPFSFTVSTFEGRFGGGSATVNADAFACNEFGCDSAEVGPISTKLTPSR
jgi:hypothetical protein